MKATRHSTKTSFLNGLQPWVARPWDAWLKAHQIADEHLSITTRDGIVLHVERLHPRTEALRGAVLLCHGMASNGLALNYPQRSLAAYLAQQGFDCFVPDLRGARHSTRPMRGWRLDDYLEHDLPTLLSATRTWSGCDRVHWLGHSLGGLLLLLYLAEFPDAPVDRIVTVGSALDYGTGDCFYRRLLPLREAIRLLDHVPFGLLSHWLSPLAGLGPAMPPESINFWRGNVEVSVVRTLLAAGFESIPVPLLRDLATTFDTGGFVRREGAVPCLQQVHQIRRPTCLLAGSRDLHCPVTAVEATAGLLSGAAEREVLRFGRRYGHAEEYGHFDLLVGRHAQQEVWPAIGAWLATTSKD